MGTPEPITRVLFRTWKPSVLFVNGEVEALLVDEPGTSDPYTCAAYARIGQHGSADPQHVMEKTRPATPSEYADLERELEGIGYSLKIVKRIPRNAIDVRRKQLEGKA